MSRVYLDPLSMLRRHLSADIIRLDRILAMATIDKDQQLYGARASRSNNGIKSGTSSAPREQDVVDQNHVPILQIRKVRYTTSMRRVITKPGNIQTTCHQLGMGDPVDGLHERTRHNGSSTLYSNYDKVFRASISLDDLMGQTIQRTADLFIRHDASSHWNIALRLPHVLRTAVLV